MKRKYRIKMKLNGCEAQVKYGWLPWWRAVLKLAGLYKEGFYGEDELEKSQQ